MKLGSTTNTPNRKKLSWKGGQNKTTHLQSLRIRSSGCWRTLLLQGLRDLCQRGLQTEQDVQRRRGFMSGEDWLKAPRLFQGYPTFSKQLTTHVPCLRALRESPTVNRLKSLQIPDGTLVGPLERRGSWKTVPTSAPNSKVVGHRWHISSFKIFPVCPLPPPQTLPQGCPFSHTQEEKDWETHDQVPRPGIPAFSVISPFQSFPFLCLMRPVASIIPRGPLSSAGSMCWLCKHSPPGRSHHLKFQERAMLNRSEWTVESGSPSHTGSALAGTLHGDWPLQWRSRQHLRSLVHGPDPSIHVLLGVGAEVVGPHAGLLGLRAIIDESPHPGVHSLETEDGDPGQRG